MQVMGRRMPIYFIDIFLMSISWSMFTIMGSLLLKSVVDIAQTGDTKKLILSSVQVIIGGIISLLVYKEATIAYNVEAKRAYGLLYSKLFEHELHLPYDFYEKHHSGEVMSKLSFDLERVASVYGSKLRRTVAPLLQVIVYLIPMLLLNWQITLCLVGANLILLFLNTLFIKPIQESMKKMSIINQCMTEKMSNILQGMIQVRMHDTGKQTVADFVIENGNYEKESNKKNIYTSCLESCSKGFDLICSLLFLLIGIYFIQNGYATLGAITAIYAMYNNFSSQFLQLGKYLPELLGCLINAENIFEFLSEPREPDSWYDKGVRRSQNILEEGVINFETSEKVVVKNLTFSYNSEKKLFFNCSMKIGKATSVAITGPSGCGKTTLTKILLGLYPVYNGNVYIDGKSICYMTNKEIREKFSFVPQEPYLFNGSIKDNIRMGRLNASDDDIMQAARMAHAHEFIIKLDNQYETEVGERGNKLSRGQRQRIALARAIIKDADIMMLDEATSALDNESELLINATLKKMSEKKTVIMITHRPSTIALVEQIITV